MEFNLEQEINDPHRGWRKLDFFIIHFNYLYGVQEETDLVDEGITTG